MFILATDHSENITVVIHVVHAAAAHFTRIPNQKNQFCSVVHSDGILNQFATYVSDSVSDARIGRQPNARKCFGFNGQFGAGSTKLLNCTSPVDGRYVSIVLTGNQDRLVFCEMEVYGYEINGMTACTLSLSLSLWL